MPLWFCVFSVSTYCSVCFSVGAILSCTDAHKSGVVVPLCTATEDLQSLLLSTCSVKLNSHKLCGFVVAVIAMHFG